MVRYSLVFGICVFAGAAFAAPARLTCGEMVGGLESYLAAHPAITGTRRQTREAQLNHQPTQRSVAKARQDSRGDLVAMLAKAKAQQSAGDARGCQSTLAGVEWMLRP